MRQSLFILFILLISITTKSQDKLFPLNSEGKEEIQEVVELQKSKLDLFSSAQEWIAITFGDYKSVLQFEDKETGKIIVKGISKIEHNGIDLLGDKTESLHFTIIIEFQDNKYRYTITDLSIKTRIDMFSTIYDRNNIPKDHLIEISNSRETVQKIERRVDSLSKIDKINLKRKKIKEIQKDIESDQSYIEYKKRYILSEAAFYNEEYQSVLFMAESMKKHLAKTSSF